MIAAISENRVIADKNGIPWYIPEDTKQYKERIKDEVVVYGNGTFNPDEREIPPSKHQIVLTRSEKSIDRECTTYVTGIIEAINVAKDFGTDELFILGGGEIYAAFLPLADRMVLSEIPGEYEGTVYFPEWNESNWNESKQEDGYEEFTITHYERKREPITEYLKTSRE